MSLIDSTADMIARKGAAFTLWRDAIAAGANEWTAGTKTPSFYPCRARQRYYDPRKVVGTINQNESLIIVSAPTLAVVPKPGDRIAKGAFTSNQAGAQWQQVIAVDIPIDGADVPVYRLKVAA